MSDADLSRPQDGFWNRVRTALDALRPADRDPAFGRAEIDRSAGASLEALEQELRRSWAQSAAKGAPLSLLLIEIDRFGDYLTAYGSGEAETCVQTLGQLIGAALDSPEALGLAHGRYGFAIVLPGIGKPQAKAVALRIAAELERQNMPHKESHAGVVTACFALATTRPAGAYDGQFLLAAVDTLRQAQRRGMGRMMAIDLQPQPQRLAA
jgi:diguanylate cyclase (GGDEF)-like protein